VPKRRIKLIFEKLCQRVRPHNTVLHVTAPIEPKLSVGALPGIASAPSYEADPARQVSVLGLARRVVFHGHVLSAAKTEAYATADIMCLT
jgi:hypothetical protein